MPFSYPTEQGYFHALRDLHILTLLISVDTGNNVEEKNHTQYLEILILLIIQF